MNMYHKLRILRILRAVGAPFSDSKEVVIFSYHDYRVALSNKVALMYLSHCKDNGLEAVKLYEYHSSRFKNLLNMLCHVCRAFNEHCFKYTVFKTIRPFEEDVADIDILLLSNDSSEYEEVVRVLKGLGYVSMEKGLYCTTFMDPRHRYATELMVDVYRKVSVGPLIYLDKRILHNHVILKDVNGCKVRALDSVAELLVTIAHSVIKEVEIKLLDYLTALYLLYSMDEEGMAVFIRLVNESGLIYGTRLFLSLVAYLHKLAHGFIPDKLRMLLNMLGGAININNVINHELPPYRLSSTAIARVFMEKLGDPIFRSSAPRGLRWFLSRRSILRLAHAFSHR